MGVECSVVRVNSQLLRFCFFKIKILKVIVFRIRDTSLHDFSYSNSLLSTSVIDASGAYIMYLFGLYHGRGIDYTELSTSSMSTHRVKALTNSARSIVPFMSQSSSFHRSWDSIP